MQTPVGARDESGEEVRLHERQREVPAARSSTQPTGCSESLVAPLSSPIAATSPANTANTAIEARNENTGNHASDLSDLRTAHERLAISHEVWNRVMPSVSAISARGLKSDP